MTRKLATRYWSSLTGSGATTRPRERHRAGYGFGRRYLAALLGISLGPRPTTANYQPAASTQRVTTRSTRMAWLAAAVCVSLVGLIATFVTRDDPQLNPVGSTASQTPHAFMFDNMPTVAQCVTYQGYGTPPMEGRAILVVSDSRDRFYEADLTFDDSGRWTARDVVVGTAEDTGRVFDLMVFAVTPDVAEQLATHVPPTLVASQPGRLLGQTRVTRGSAPGTC